MMASSSKNVMMCPLDLTLKLETAEGVQEQLFIDACKASFAALEAELKEITVANRHVKEINLEAERRTWWLWFNHGNIMAMWERVQEAAHSKASQ